MQKIEYIHVNVLHPHPDNPRKDLGDITELAESIKAKGVLQNLTVVADDQGDYRIVIGHRRHAAGKLAGCTNMPCVVTYMTPQEQFETMMVENVQRSDLTVYEQAEGFQMMLDMGGTVEQVAQKTGFSVTTIRNRVGLLQLDKKKFHKAEQRGASLTDYIRLNAIKDPVRRNNVLDTIGTSEFEYALKNAVEDQKFAAKFDLALKAIQETSWCKERTDEDTSYGGPYKSWRYFDKYNQDPIIPPKDKDTATYIYSIENNIRIYIYRKGPDGEKRTPVEAKKDRYREQANQIEKQLSHLNKIHREIREDFVRNFSTFNNHQLDIEAFAAKAMVAYTYGSGDIELLGKLSVIPVDPKKNLLDDELWKKLLFNHPQRALLYATYAKVEKIGNKYYTTQWYDKVGFSVPKHQKDDLLDVLYDGLCSLGYEMSDGEIQLQNGSHPLFKEAKDLIAAFKKEVI